MNKKNILIILILFLATNFFFSQRHEIGYRVGTSNLVGDIGKTNFFLQSPLNNISNFGIPFYGGIIYRMNFNPHQTLRFDLGYNHIQFDDRAAKEEYRRNRRFFGTNNLLEANAIFEYNFFPVNNEQKNGLLSPYIFGGIGAMMYDINQATISHDFRRDENNVAQAPTNELDFKSSISYNSDKRITGYIPLGVGLKYKFNHNWAVSAEIMARAVLTDQLDYNTLNETKDVKSTYNADILSPNTNLSLLQTLPYLNVAEAREKEFVNNRKIGNLVNNDWVNSVTLSLTYSFGRPPCYCD